MYNSGRGNILPSLNTSHYVHDLSLSGSCKIAPATTKTLTPYFRHAYKLSLGYSDRLYWVVTH